MLTSRSLFRIDRVLGFTSRCVKSTPGSFSIMSSGAKADPSSMGGCKKQKMVNLEWRRISTQSTSVAAVNEGQEALCSASSDVTVSEEVTQFVEGVNEGSGSDIGSRTLRVNEEISVVTAEKHSVSLEVGASVIRFIRGKEGSTQKTIEEETGVKIILPSSRKEDCISIEGISVECVTRASERIETIINEAVMSPSLDYSHFISLPLAIHPELVEKLVNFQNSILGNNDTEVYGQDENSSENEKGQPVNKESGSTVEMKADSETYQANVDVKRVPLVSYLPKAEGTESYTLYDLGIEKSIFIKPKTFHLTVLMLKLWNKDRLNAAHDLLQSIYPSVMDALDNRPLSVRLKGLDCMKGSLAKARVLYAPVEELGNEGRLLRACQVIIDAYVKAGLVLEKDAKQSLKLHATVMNARHRKSKDRRRKMDTFDAREIHKRFGNEEWGEYLIPEAHLSQRFVFGENGYYHCCASLPFPSKAEAEA
ncbi:PREDICTED: uncharacterized protein LOC104817973 isoform X2 [Tarenaya hassleriana]|uniref:uncharacterized protein LOC104817973 isoform X2 n=1 Tax=Tarenaya hassleriana TaxID=28532 RepID=UPI00053C7AF6|nr:PREDICTED: uncharacterized protein LOC104817973 isoform X2 [Tarenaya hassleriana]